MFKNVFVKIVGATPLMMHNRQLVDPENKWTKKIKALASKRSKITDEQRVELKFVEWMGGLYIKSNRIVVPADALEATIINGAKQSKEGKLAQAGMMVENDAPLIYPGTHDPEKLYAGGGHCDYRAVRIGQAKIMRSRPIFLTWSCAFEVSIEMNIIKSVDMLHGWIETAGMVIGLLERRPKFGKFMIESLETSNG